MALTCICKHPDPWECMRIRHPEMRHPFTDEEGWDCRDDEACDCRCHDEDEDGWSPWEDVLRANSGPSGDTPDHPVCPDCGGEAGHRCRGVAGPADEWTDLGDPVG